MIKKLLFVSILFFSTGSISQAMGPDELIRKTSEKLLGEFTTNRSTYEADRSSLYKMVNRIAIPHFDFDRITRIVLGRHYSAATPEQRHQFAEEFKTLLVRTYSQALFQYSDEKIKYIPAIPYGNGMIVREEIDVGAAVPVRLEYLLSKKDGNWKVYDIRIDGISLVTTFRKSYNITISRKGLSALIVDLQKKNSIQ
ncbi:MAG: ABC transporter substrate-binding protein [Gammaproteobacteria bacterium]|nr:ABC transporter substrate-binding protein [Gammaproteobacteria bacterium]